MMNLLRRLTRDPDAKRSRKRRISRSLMGRSSSLDVVGVLFDSQRGEEPTLAACDLYDRLCRILQHELFSKGRRFVRRAPLEHAIVSQQANSYDCGVYVLFFAEYVYVWFAKYLHWMTRARSLEELRAALENLNRDLLERLRSVKPEDCRRKRDTLRKRLLRDEPLVVEL